MDLLLIGQMIALGLATLSSVSLSMAENIPISLILRLRGSAVSLHRASGQQALVATVGLFLLALALLTPAPGEEPAAPKKTPLDDYIAKADPTYSWKLVQTIPGDGYTTFVIDLKSQSWRSPPEVDRAL